MLHVPIPPLHRHLSVCSIHTDLLNYNKTAAEKSTVVEENFNLSYYNKIAVDAEVHGC
jgi:hypothetical protein